MDSLETAFDSALQKLKVAMRDPAIRNLYDIYNSCLASYDIDNSETLTNEIKKLSEYLWSHEGNAVPFWVGMSLYPIRDDYVQKEQVNMLINNPNVVRSYLLLAHAFDTSETFIENSQGDKRGLIFEKLGNFEQPNSAGCWLEAIGKRLFGDAWYAIDLAYEINNASTEIIKNTLKSIPDELLVKNVATTPVDMVLPLNFNV